MAQLFTKTILSGSTNGKQIKVVATASSGTTIHTAVSGTSSMDEVWLYAYNSHSADVVLTIQWGGTTSPDNDIKINIPFQQGRFLVCDGMILNNSNVIRAYAGTANVIMIDGFVNRIT